MERPLVSVITSTYNSSRFIGETIRSIQSQTLSDWEMLVTDDCSTDGTLEILQRFAAEDSRIKVFPLQQNVGAGKARNHSIEQASGRYIAFCDSDDRWYPEKLERQIGFMRKKDCALSFSSYTVCDEKGEVCGLVVARSQLNFRAIRRYNKIGCLTAVYDTEKVGKMLMSPMKKRQDWGLWISIIRKGGPAFGLREPLAIYRDRDDSISCRKLTLVKYNASVYHDVLGYGWLRSYFCFFFINFPSYLLKKTRDWLTSLK